MFGRSQDDDDESDDEWVSVRQKREVTFDYTEHDAVVGFVNNETRTITFDEMRNQHQSTQLYNYDKSAGLIERCGNDELGPENMKPVATLMHNNLEFIHTVERREKQIKGTRTEAFEADREYAEELVEEDPERYEIIEE